LGKNDQNVNPARSAFLKATQRSHAEAEAVDEAVTPRGLHRIAKTGRQAIPDLTPYRSMSNIAMTPHVGCDVILRPVHGTSPNRVVISIGITDFGAPQKSKKPKPYV
jgi:hypothetical protein